MHGNPGGPVGACVSRSAWQGWRFRWQADTPGRTTLACRATDESGEVQPVDQPWNRQGMANNLVQRVPVLVRAL